MRYNDTLSGTGLVQLRQGFQDLDEIAHLLPPNVVVKAANISYREIIAAADEYIAGKIRKVIYEAVSGTNTFTKYYLELVPYIHPVGAATITLGTVATSATGVVTYTPTKEGFQLTETGVAIPSGCDSIDVAGLLFTDYYTKFDDNIQLHENYRVLTIAEGDFLWMMRRGEVELAYTGAAPALDDILMASTTVDGKVEVATAINTAGTIAQYHATLKVNLLGDANPNYEGLARALAAGSGGLVRANLLLPPRHRR